MSAASCSQLSIPPVIVPAANGRGFWRKWWHSLRALGGRNTTNDGWQDALPELMSMDSRLLEDIGAPAWVISEISWQQQRHTRDIEDLLMGQYGCAAAKLL
jgi:hypothetical protein